MFGMFYAHERKKNIKRIVGLLKKFLGIVRKNEKKKFKN